jgi:hypothetical protein
MHRILTRYDYDAANNHQAGKHVEEERRCDRLHFSRRNQG